LLLPVANDIPQYPYHFQPNNTLSDIFCRIALELPKGEFAVERRRDASTGSLSRLSSVEITNPPEIAIVIWPSVSRPVKAGCVSFSPD
jgi:aspartate/methionine/tyrosine aminotransferase